jgi:sigma-E factor negative regulatory protein RseB
MHLRSLFAWSLACAAIGFAHSAHAQDASLDAPSARAWLTRIHDASASQSFRGTFVVSASGMISGSRVVHYCSGSDQYERIESLDGQVRQVLRHNDVVHTVWPTRRVVLVEQRGSVSTFPSLLHGAGDDGFVDHYQVRVEGTDRVAGFDAQVLRVQPRDAQRYGYRLWSEKATGLLLRAEVLGMRDEVLEAAAFTELVLGVKPQPQSVVRSMKTLDGYRIIRPQVVETRLEDEGWSMRVSVPGFRQISCVKRVSPAAQDGWTGSGPLLQSVWSDGLTSVSVFIEPFDAQQHTRELQTSIGATQTLMRRFGEWWLTVMGDVPAPTLREFAKGIERVR